MIITDNIQNWTSRNLFTVYFGTYIVYYDIISYKVRMIVFWYFDTLWHGSLASNLSCTSFGNRGMEMMVGRPTLQHKYAHIV